MLTRAVADRRARWPLGPSQSLGYGWGRDNPLPLASAYRRGVTRHLPSMVFTRLRRSVVKLLRFSGRAPLCSRRVVPQSTDRVRCRRGRGAGGVRVPGPRAARPTRLSDLPDPPAGSPTLLPGPRMVAGVEHPHPPLGRDPRAKKGPRWGSKNGPFLGPAVHSPGGVGGLRPLP